jgi:RNA polymerase sigma-70 factor (ECF subfamily)
VFRGALASLAGEGTGISFFLAQKKMDSIANDGEPMNRATQPVAAPNAEMQRLAADLHAKSGAEKFGISRDDLAVILGEVAQKYVGAESGAQVRAFCLSLKIEELVLARACAAGNERAWEVFMARYREKLYEVGLQITREESAGRELSDSLYADLYGTVSRDGVRVSKLASYTGRGSIEGWLRTVMAQEHVNRYRRQRRMVSLDEEAEEGVQFAAATTAPVASVDPRLESATDEALAALSPEERFMLAAYFLDGRTLAEIARMLSVHESTISRKLDKLAKGLRKQILAGLGRRGMSRRQAEEALEVDVRDLTLNLRDTLTQDSPGDTFHKKNVGAPAQDGSG